jgi:putative endonuclease
MTYFVYILQSRINDSFYKGSTNDLLRRFAEHNDGKEESTSRYLPWDLVWYATKPDRSEAVVLEMWRWCANQGADRSVSIQFPPSPH